MHITITFSVEDNPRIKVLNLLEKNNIRTTYINPTIKVPVLIIVKIKPIII